MGYTAQMAQSEEVGLRLRQRHRSVFAPLAQRYHGAIIDENGDELSRRLGTDLAHPERR